MGTTDDCSDAKQQARRRPDTRSGKLFDAMTSSTAADARPGRGEDRGECDECAGIGLCAPHSPGDRDVWRDALRQCRPTRRHEATDDDEHAE